MRRVEERATLKKKNEKTGGPKGAMNRQQNRLLCHLYKK